MQFRQLLLHAKKRLMRPRVLVAGMDLSSFYRGRLLPERYEFCVFIQNVSFSMFKVSRLDFEVILLSVRELPLV